MTHNSDSEVVARALGALVAREAEAAAPADWLERGALQLRTVQASSSATPRKREKSSPPALLALAALVATALALVVVWFLPSRAITYEVLGAGRFDGSRVEAPIDGSAEVVFSEGSRVVLAAGASLRVRETTSHGATLALERGAATTSVVPRAHTRFSMSAGSYEVFVVGTRFHTSWDPAARAFRVDLEAGSVRIVGAGIQGQVDLGPGQRFEGHEGSGTWRVTAIDASPAVPPTPSLPPSSVPMAVPTPTASGRVPAASAAPPPPEWSVLLQRGEFGAVVADAKARGIEVCLSGCKVGDLRALADAARYTGDLALAERALHALRQRSPGEATRAAYLLGSLAEARNDRAAALRWYSEYVAAAPGGAFAAEARAGRLRMLLATGGRDAARPAAEEYLRLHPTGVGAATAKKILGSP